MRCSRSHCAQAARKNSSSKSLLHSVLNLHAGLVQAAVQVEHADQSRPLARPVGHGEDRSAMAEQAGENMIAVLPHRFGDHQRRIRGECA